MSTPAGRLSEMKAAKSPSEQLVKRIITPRIVTPRTQEEAHSFILKVSLANAIVCPDFNTVLEGGEKILLVFLNLMAK